jgi:hypothetical protein
MARFALLWAMAVGVVGLLYLYFSHAYPFVSDYVNGFKTPDIFDIATVFFMLAAYGLVAGVALWFLKRALHGVVGSDEEWRTEHRHPSHRV